MHITHHELDDRTLRVTLKGSLDIDGSAAAGSHLAERIGEFDNIVIDLKDVDRIAMSGFRLLANTANELGERGGKLVVANPSDAARRFLWTTGLDSIVTLADDEASAIDAEAGSRDYRPVSAIPVPVSGS